MKVLFALCAFHLVFFFFLSGAKKVDKFSAHLPGVLLHHHLLPTRFFLFLLVSWEEDTKRSQASACIFVRR